MERIFHHRDAEDAEKTSVISVPLWLSFLSLHRDLPRSHRLLLLLARAFDDERAVLRIDGGVELRLPFGGRSASARISHSQIRQRMVEQFVALDRALSVLRIGSFDGDVAGFQHENPRAHAAPAAEEL